ncbi:restriction endonuclease subunit S [Helicobacter bizzozeronii]|uniref:restriction endonuclease subunit S n=1 Tax=Helicobacter bizzozeronii TaxID=56877 RepID=UPI00131554CB|nr:restriction endonuclease subunit S [Helicobacter bizzozeronii]
MLLSQKKTLLQKIRQSMLELLLTTRALRFKGESGAWEEVELSNCTEKTKNIVWQNDPDDYVYIDLTSVDRNTHDITETATINAKTAPSRAIQIIQADDVLLGTTRPLLKRYTLVEPKYDGQICSTGFCILRSNPSVVLSQWIYYNIASYRFSEYARVWQEGANYPMLANRHVFSYKIPLPPLPTQQKIAHLLSTLDRLIELTHQEQQLLARITRALRDQLIYKEN